MPSRLMPFITDEIYHVVNRGISERQVFSDAKEYSRAIEVINYYRYKSPPLKFSLFLKQSLEFRQKVIDSLRKKGKELVDILCFCLMPSHFHILLKQKIDNGVSKFLSIFQNSYTRYFNIKNERRGPLFYDQFKAKRIVTDEQLLHVSRYIHLNPYSSFVVRKAKDLESYTWSSLPYYLEDNMETFCKTEIILDFFKTKQKHHEFVFDQANYQRELDIIKHLILEK